MLMGEMNRTSPKTRNEPKEHRVVGFEWQPGQSLGRLTAAQ